MIEQKENYMLISKHNRVGDYCNNCDCHISECQYWKNK